MESQGNLQDSLNKYSSGDFSNKVFIFDKRFNSEEYLQLNLGFYL